MPSLCEFNTDSVRRASEPRPDTWATVAFPHPFIARPRLPCGFRQLDVNKCANVRVKAPISYSTDSWADCHISAWSDTRLHGGIAHILALAPADLDFLTGEHMRRSGDPSSVRVNFERGFVTPPKVVVFFNYIDLDKNRNWRLHVSASDIDVNGFTIHINTWGDTIMYAVQACWIAYPEDRAHTFNTTINTMDVRPVSKPQKEQSKDVTFGGVKFWEDPAVFVALNLIDIDCTANLRVRAYVDGVCKTGLVWHIDTWHDTVLYAAGASIIAFN